VSEFVPMMCCPSLLCFSFTARRFACSLCDSHLHGLAALPCFAVLTRAHSARVVFSAEPRFAVIHALGSLSLCDVAVFVVQLGTTTRKQANHVSSLYTPGSVDSVLFDYGQLIVFPSPLPCPPYRCWAAVFV
jgi:hypothetical protein